MVKFYHRYITRAEKNKDGNYITWDLEQLIATDNIAAFNKGKKIKFKELAELPRELRLAGLDQIVTVYLAHHVKGKSLNKP